MTLIELDKILLVPPEKWESLIHRPRRFELGIDISRTVSRGRFVHRGRLTYRADEDRARVDFEITNMIQ